MTGGEREEEEMAVRAAVMETVAHRQEELQVAELTMLRVWLEVSRMDRSRKKKIRGTAQVQQSCSQTVCWMLQKLTQCVFKFTQCRNKLSLQHYHRFVDPSEQLEGRDELLNVSTNKVIHY